MGLRFEYNCEARIQPPILAPRVQTEVPRCNSAPDPTLPDNRLARNRELARRRMARHRGAEPDAMVDRVWRKVLELPPADRAEIMCRMAKLQAQTRPVG